MEAEVRNNLSYIIDELNNLSIRLYEIRYRRWEARSDPPHTTWTRQKRNDAAELQLPIIALLEELHGTPIPLGSASNDATIARSRYERAWVVGLKLLAQIDGPSARRMFKLFKQHRPTKAAKRRARFGYLAARLSYSMHDDS